ncbi:MAG: CBS domain-containing protein [Candidatus Bathyarchaeia archaeon]
MLSVRDVMVTDVIAVSPETVVKEAVRVMNEFDIGCVVVAEDGNVVGILTERDVLKRVVEEGRNPENTRVSDVMSKPPVTVSPEASLETAIEIMFKFKVKKLPVVEEGKLVGLVTFTDLARAEPALIETVKRLTQKYEIPKSLNKVVKYYVV